MYSIAYVVPYFGKFPKGFQFWLMSCGCNPSIDWLIFTDDRTDYDYPDNVKVTYWTFDQMRTRVQSIFDFPISLERPYKLCDYKPAYGEIFERELRGYDFWGDCDIDLVWGDIRKFYTDEVLENYEKVGFNGHSMLFRNTPQVCSRYRTCVEGALSYRDVFSVDQGFAFDEPGMDAIYEALGIPVYKEIDFANLLKYDYGFYLDWQDEEDREKNEAQVFTWSHGVVTRHYLYKGRIETKEYLYLHYWCRPTSFRIHEYDPNKQYLIYPDVTTDKPFHMDEELIRRKSKRSKVKYYAKSIWFNRHKITLERIVFNVKGMLGYKNGC